MSKTTFGFARQNEVGKSGEQLLLENYYDGKLQKLDKLSPIGDFMRPDGKIIEVKTDTYPMSRTENFFMEFYSNKEKKTLGGPWRAFDKGADVPIYLFVSDLIYFEFTALDKLVKELESVIKTAKLKQQDVLNHKHITTGYKIPRESLSALYTRHQIAVPAVPDKVQS